MAGDSPKKDKLAEISRGLVAGIDKQGHHAQIINGDNETEKKLSVYDYLAVGTISSSFLGGKIPPVVSRFLSNAGHITGKRSFAFVLKSGLRTNKTLLKLMQAMEHEGLYLKFSEAIVTPAEGEEIGKQLHIDTTNISKIEGV